MNFFTCDFQTLLCLYFGGSKTFFLFVCISRIFYNLRNHNVVKHSLVENRIFWGLYDFLHQHGSLIKSMFTSCKNSKSTSVEVEESGVKGRVILFRMSNYLSCISTYDNCIGSSELSGSRLKNTFVHISLCEEEWHDGIDEKARLRSNAGRRCIV